MAALLSIYLLLKSLSSKLLTPPSADKNNSCTQLKDCSPMTLSHWSFSSKSGLGFFFYIAAPFPALFILTILLDKFQKKSCFEDINILNKAIKFFNRNKFSLYPYITIYVQFIAKIRTTRIKVVQHF